MPRTAEIKSTYDGSASPLDGFDEGANQSRRLLPIAAVLDGMIRAEAARIGRMDRQTVREVSFPDVV